MTVGADEGTTTRRRLSQQSDRVRLIARLRRHLRHRGAAFVVDHDVGHVHVLHPGWASSQLECGGVTTTVMTGDRWNAGG